ncbi:unnamed protein product [Amoebophrya sp. A120]|nr:unnamed protein product [Amoebophrya sp. A120]|eukprot:GSA120T00006436001.1
MASVSPMDSDFIAVHLLYFTISLDCHSIFKERTPATSIFSPVVSWSLRPAKGQTPNFVNSVFLLLIPKPSNVDISNCLKPQGYVVDQRSDACAGAVLLVCNI